MPRKKQSEIFEIEEEKPKRTKAKSKREISDERRAVLLEQLKKAREAKRNKKSGKPVEEPVEEVPPTPSPEQVEPPQELVDPEPKPEPKPKIEEKPLQEKQDNKLMDEISFLRNELSELKKNMKREHPNKSEEIKPIEKQEIKQEIKQDIQQKVQYSKPIDIPPKPVGKKISIFDGFNF